MANFQGQGQGKNKFSAKDIEKIFWTKVNKDSEDKCWNFTGGNTNGGYGIFRGKGAHRYSWELFHKTKIPYGKFVLHTCDNPSCVNPKHLYIGTQQDNINDRWRRNRHKISKEDREKITFSHTLLTAKQIQKIRSLKGKSSLRAVAKIFGVSTTPIFSIWKSDKHPCREGYYA